jgi:uncharacterized membrane protein (DUF485 family)
MEKQNNKFLDDLSRKIIKESDVESPSFNFTNSVMKEIKALNEGRTTVYKPLISKTSWFFISLSVLALVLYVLFFGTETEATRWMQSLDFSILSNFNTDILPSFSYSKTFSYAILFFGLMICIQIPLLKSQFDKRFDV